jgi:8-oxo-dGTP diphosphatase
MNQMKKTIQVVVLGVVKKGDKYLLTMRDDNDSKFDGKWQLPGGGLEFDESIEDCLKRELREEVGLDIVSYVFIPRLEEEIRENWHGVFCNFLCFMKDENQPVVLNDEASDFGWFTLHQLENLDLIPHTYELVRDAAELAIKS